MNEHLQKMLHKTIRFHNSETSLTKNGKHKVEKIAKILMVHPEVAVTVVGLSTATGSFGKKLTKGRAETTIKYLKKFGVKNKLKGRGVSGSKVYGIRMHSSGGKPTIPAGCTKKEEYLCVGKANKVAKTAVNTTNTTAMNIITTRLRMSKKPNDDDVTKFVSWAAKEVTQEMDRPSTPESAATMDVTQEMEEPEAAAAMEVNQEMEEPSMPEAAAAENAKALAAARHAKVDAAKSPYLGLAVKEAKVFATKESKSLAAKDAKALAAKQAAEAEHLSEIAQEGLHMAHKDAIIATQASSFRASSDAAYANAILGVAHQGIASMHTVRKGLQAEAAVQQSIDDAAIRDVHRKLRKARAADLLARSSMVPVAQPKKADLLQDKKAQPLLVSPAVQPAALTTASMNVESKATAFASFEKNGKKQAFRAGQKKEESYMKAMAKLQALKQEEKAMQDKIIKQYPEASGSAAVMQKPQYRTRSDLANEAIEDREKAAKLRLKASYGLTSGNLHKAQRQQNQQAKLTSTSIQDQERATKLRTAQAFGIGRESAQKSQAASLTGSSIRDSERDGKSRISKAFGGVPTSGADLKVNPNGSLQSTQHAQADNAKKAYSKYLASQEATQKKFADAISESKAALKKH